MYTNASSEMLRSFSGIAVAEDRQFPKAGPVDVPHSRKPWGPGRPFEEPAMRGVRSHILTPGGTVMLKDASYVTSTSLSSVLPSREQMVSPPHQRPASVSLRSMRQAQSGATNAMPDSKRLMQRPAGYSVTVPSGIAAGLGSSRQARPSYQSRTPLYSQGEIPEGTDALQGHPTSALDAGPCTSIEAPPGGLASVQQSSSQQGVIFGQIPANQLADVSRSVHVPSNPTLAQGATASCQAAGSSPASSAPSSHVLGPLATPLPHSNRQRSPMQQRNPVQHNWRPGAVKISSPPPSFRSAMPEPVASCAFQQGPPSSAALPGQVQPGFEASSGSTVPTVQSPPGLMRRISQAQAGQSIVRQFSSSCQSPPGGAPAWAGPRVVRQVSSSCQCPPSDAPAWGGPHVVRQSSSCNSPPGPPGTPSLGHRQVVVATSSCSSPPGPPVTPIVSHRTIAVAPRSPLQVSRSVRTLVAEPLTASQQSRPPLAQARTIRRSVSATPRLTRGVSAPALSIPSQTVSISTQPPPVAFVEPVTSALPTHRGSEVSGPVTSALPTQRGSEASFDPQSYHAGENREEDHKTLPEWMEMGLEQQLKQQEVLLQTSPLIEGLTVPEEEEGLRPDWAYLYCEADRERCEMKQKLAEEVREKRDLEFRIALVKRQLEEKTAQVAELMGDGSSASASLSPSEETKFGQSPSFTQ
eukprot:TRINITY_DN29879_c0_g1_i1.p1 TRINITY_DN29879_c0_g1~~TRINITY_DN29879_c0_g1_i1.p1  ORF type:complete len:694 (-),score=85.81 TRINITY_DN29879_c0_g1_i1:34-2115(-)